jgi:hypothetical protein
MQQVISGLIASLTGLASIRLTQQVTHQPATIAPGCTETGKYPTFKNNDAQLRVWR